MTDAEIIAMAKIDAEHLNTDGSHYMDVVSALLGCAASCKDEVRILGNVRAGDMKRALIRIIRDYYEDYPPKT